MSQPWKISQAANKDKGRCSVCKAIRQIHLNDGLVHLHGPRDNRCPGSKKLPLNDPDGNHTHTVIQSGTVSDPGHPASAPSTLASLPPGGNCFVWCPRGSSIIKFIPKSARNACATNLTHTLREVVDNPQDSDKWKALFDWTENILSLPVRNGK